jgi:hypothetical protein
MQTLTDIKLKMVDKIKHIFLVLILPTKSVFKNKKLCRIQHSLHRLSGTYIILLNLRTILFTWRYIGPNTHTLKCRNEEYQYYSNRT